METGSNFKDLMFKAGKFFLEKELYAFKHVVVKYDPDVDGLLSGYMATTFLNQLGIESTSIINEDRAHGIRNDEIFKPNTFLINLDSGLSLEDLDYLLSNGVSVLSLDHHDIEQLYGVNEVSINNPCLSFRNLGGWYFEKEGYKALIINNQYESIDNSLKFLSGGGVVFEFLEYLNKELVDSLNLKPLVGITLLSDIRDIETPLARGYLDATYDVKLDVEFSKDIYYLFALLKDKYDFGILYLDRNFIDYRLNPLLNSLFRFNVGYTALEAIKFNEKESYDYLYLRATNTYSLQKELVVSFYDSLSISKISSLALVLFNDDNSEYISNCLGLLANKVMNDNSDITSVLIICTGDLGFKRGSFRSSVKTVSALNVLREFGLDVAGHQTAFGVKSKQGLVLSNGSLDIDKLMAIAYRLEELKQLNGIGRQELISIPSLMAKLKDIKLKGIENTYKLSDNYTYYQISQSVSVVIKYAKKNYSVLEIDGVEVKAFEFISEDTFLLREWVLDPVIKNRGLQLYLRKI